MKIKGLAVVMACMCCLTMPMQVNAAEEETAEANAVSTEQVEPLAAELIANWKLEFTNNSRTIYITAKTIATEQMSEIGFTDIKVQRSLDRTNWTTEVTVSDKIIQDATMHSLESYSVTVRGGYYYRVQLNHYAKEDTWLFPDEQSKTSMSSYIWIP